MLIMETPAFKRILLKLSGEALAGEKGFGYDFDTVSRLADEVVAVSQTGASVGLVIGGGNIVRGSQLSKTLSPLASWCSMAPWER